MSHSLNLAFLGAKCSSTAKLREPVETSGSVSAGTTLVVVRKARPCLLERQLRVSADVDGQVIFVGHAVATADLFYLFELPEDRAQGVARNSYAYDDIAGAVSWSPDGVAVVATDGFW